MKRMVAVVLSLVAGRAAAGGGQAPGPGRVAVHPIDRAAYGDPAQFAFLDSMLAGVEVVSLGESIHMTHEFPLVRVGIIRRLNQSLGFHVVAFEGSPEDLWIAQDRFLGSGGTVRDAERAQL